MSTSNLNSDLQHVCKWAFKWKMSFNPGPTEQAQEVIFSRKLIKPITLYPPSLTCSKCFITEEPWFNIR